MDTLKRAWKDTRESFGHTGSLVVLIAVWLVGIGILWSVFSAESQAADEIRYGGSIALASLGVGVLLFLWNLALAPYRNMRDKHSKASKERGLAVTELTSQGRAHLRFLDHAWQAEAQLYGMLDKWDVGAGGTHIGREKHLVKDRVTLIGLSVANDPPGHRLEAICGSAVLQLGFEAEGEEPKDVIGRWTDNPTPASLELGAALDHLRRRDLLPTGEVHKLDIGLFVHQTQEMYAAGFDAWKHTSSSPTPTPPRPLELNRYFLLPKDEYEVTVTIAGTNLPEPLKRRFLLRRTGDADQPMSLKAR